MSVQRPSHTGVRGTSTEAPQAERTNGPEWAIIRAKRFLKEGASMFMVESEGITDNFEMWRADVVSTMVNAL